MDAHHPHVLIIDDSDDVRDSLREVLEEHGFKVATAANGREALDLLLGGLRPCSILLDLMMPVMDGWDFRAAQALVPKLHTIPLAVLSAAGFSATSIQAQFGNVEFFSKPFALPDIVDFVKRNCRPAG